MPKVAPLHNDSRLRAILLRDDLEALAQLLAEVGINAESWTTRPKAAPTPPAAAALDPRLRDSLAFFGQPLLRAFASGAERCCRFLLRAVPASRLVAAHEEAGNVLHAVVSGTAALPRSRAAFAAILEALLTHLSEDDVRRLCARSGHLGLRPAELAVRLDQFRLAERLLTAGALAKVRQEACGPFVFVTFDLADYSFSAKKSRYLMSPPVLLAEDTSLGRLQKVKESQVLRPGSLLHVWATKMEFKKRAYVLLQISLCVLHGLLILVFGSAFSRKTLLSACNLGREPPPTVLEKAAEMFQMAVMLPFYSLAILEMLWCELCLLRSSYRHRHKQQFFSSAHIIILIQFGISSVQIVSSLLLKVVIVRRADNFCGKDDYWYHAIAEFMLDYSVVYAALYGCALNRIFDRFLSNFFRLFMQILMFFLLYFILVFVFARTFENIHFIKSAFTNDSNSDDAILYKDFLQSMYTSFRISLNTVDQSYDNTTDGVWMVAHVLYVVILPIMVFNYIIGVLSSNLSLWHETHEESSILSNVTINVFTDISLRWMAVFSVGKNDPENCYITACLPANDPCFRKKTSVKEKEITVASQQDCPQAYLQPQS